MNYKIGDKVNISLTAPLIVTDLDKHLDRIKVSSEDGSTSFWASSKFFTPHTPPSTSPHKSLNIGDLVVTKPTAITIFEGPVGSRIGRIRSIYRGVDNKMRCEIEWNYDLTTQTFINPPGSYNIVYPDQLI